MDANYFVATPTQNYIIAAVCMLLFVLFALYTKSWITIFAVFTLCIGPIAERIIPSEINKDPRYITATIIVCVVIGVFLAIYFYRKAKNHQVIE